MTDNPQVSINNRLKPCPLCGGEGKYGFNPEEDFGTWDTHYVGCIKENEHQVSVMAHTKDEAIKLWNTRV